MKRIAVYTVLFNNYDELKLPKNHKKLRNESDFFCITNDPIIKNPKEYYNILIKSELYSSPILSNRYYKILTPAELKEYEYTIYVDGSVLITADSLIELVYDILEEPKFALFRHPIRNCVYEEAKAIIDRDKLEPIEVLKHVRFLKGKKYPKNNGLHVCTVLIRKNDDQDVNVACHLWWQLFMNGAKRDKPHFDYVVSRSKVDVCEIPGALPFNVENGNAYFDHLMRRNHQHVSNRIHHKIKRKLFKKAIDIIS